jgi:hypothetical protein
MQNLVIKKLKIQLIDYFIINIIIKHNNMWKIDDFKKWDKCGRPINENVIKLNIIYSKIKILGNLENLGNIENIMV